jgi:hypothetical protein
MLNERPAHALVYDAASNVARLETGAKGGGRKTLAGQLLLDQHGFLVGVDLGGEGLSRTVVMLGPHENVDRTRAARVVVTYDADGDPAEVEVTDARAAIRADEKNPYR